MGYVLHFPQNKHGSGHMNDRRLPVWWKDKLHSSFIASVKGYWNPSAADREGLPSITNSELFSSRFEQYSVQPFVAEIYQNVNLQLQLFIAKAPKKKLDDLANVVQWGE